MFISIFKKNTCHFKRAYGLFYCKLNFAGKNTSFFRNNAGLWDLETVAHFVAHDRSEDLSINKTVSRIQQVHILHATSFTNGAHDSEAL